MSTLSVIIPVYNSELYIVDCIESILNQTFHDLDIIIINDGSTDNSLSICEQFALKDNRIHIINQENQGQSAARNKGLDAAKGDYIAFVDSDDTISKDLFTENIRILEQYTSIDFIQFPRYINYGTENKELIQFNEQIECCKENLYKNWLEDKIISWFVWDKIYRKELFYELRFQEGMIYEDNYLVADILHISNKVFISNVGTYYYWWRINSTTNKTHSLKKDVDTQKVNLHILDKIKNIKNINKGKVVILSRIFYVYISILNNFRYKTEINRIFIEEFKKTRLVDFIKSGLPLKQIIKLISAKVLGLKYFVK